MTQTWNGYYSELKNINLGESKKMQKHERCMTIAKVIATFLLVSSFPAGILFGMYVGLVIAVLALLIDKSILIYGAYKWITAD